MAISLKAGDLLPFDCLEHQIKLDRNYPFTVSYLNGHNLIKKIQRDLKSNEDYRQSFTEYFSFIEDLKTTRFWLKKDNHMITMNLLDLYQSFLHYIKENEFEDELYNCVEMSLYSPLGPFKKMSLIELVNESLAKKVILYNIIKNKMPVRKFRLNLDTNILVQYGKEFKHDKKVKLRQISENGIVFSSKDEQLLLDIEGSSKVRVYLSLKFLDGGAAGNDLFYTDYKEDIFVLDQENIKYSLSYNSYSSNEVFFYCRFNHLKGNDKIFKLGEFVKETEKTLSAQLCV